MSTSLIIIVALLAGGAIAMTLINRRRPVAQSGPVGEWWQRRSARRSKSAGARETIHRTRARKARAGVMRQALGRALQALKRQQRADAATEVRMPIATAARERADGSRAAETVVVERLRRVAPDTLGHHSGALAKLAALALFLGGCLLNANTYAEFEPSHQDGLTAALASIGLSTAWLLGAVQMLGFTILGSAIAGCLVYALAPKRSQYDGADEEPDQRIVHGHFSPAVYAVLGVVFFLFALGVAYAVARLRIYGTLLGGASSASAPGTSAAGSLGGGAGAAVAQPPGQLFTFMVLALLELVATIAVFVFLEPAVARTVRALRRQSDKDERRWRKATQRADRERTRGAAAGLDATRHLRDAALRGWQTDLDATELDAVLAERTGEPYAPDLGVLETPTQLLPHDGEVLPPRTTLLAFPPESDTTRVLNDSGYRAADYEATPNGHRPPVER